MPSLLNKCLYCGEPAVRVWLWGEWNSETSIGDTELTCATCLPDCVEEVTDTRLLTENEHVIQDMHAFLEEL